MKNSGTTSLSLSHSVSMCLCDSLISDHISLSLSLSCAGISGLGPHTHWINVKEREEREEARVRSVCAVERSKGDGISGYSERVERIEVMEMGQVR